MDTTTNTTPENTNLSSEDLVGGQGQESGTNSIVGGYAKEVGERKSTQVVYGNKDEGEKWEADFRANNTLPLHAIEGYIEAAKRNGIGICGVGEDGQFTNLRLYYPFGIPVT